jgi:hypothetical protein
MNVRFYNGTVDPNLLAMLHFIGQCPTNKRLINTFPGLGFDAADVVL